MKHFKNYILLIFVNYLLGCSTVTLIKPTDNEALLVPAAIVVKVGRYADLNTLVVEYEGRDISNHFDRVKENNRISAQPNLYCSGVSSGEEVEIFVKADFVQNKPRLNFLRRRTEDRAVVKTPIISVVTNRERNIETLTISLGGLAAQTQVTLTPYDSSLAIKGYAFGQEVVLSLQKGNSEITVPLELIQPLQPVSTGLVITAPCYRMLEHEISIK